MLPAGLALSVPGLTGCVYGGLRESGCICRGPASEVLNRDPWETRFVNIRCSRGSRWKLRLGVCGEGGKPVEMCVLGCRV